MQTQEEIRTMNMTGSIRVALFAITVLAASIGATLAADIPFVEPTVLGDSTPGAFDIHFVDIDNDGDQDIIAASANDDRSNRLGLMVKLFLNRGVRPASFDRLSVSPGGRFGLNSILYAKSVTSGDIDGDGTPDVVSGSMGKVAWHRTDTSVNPISFGTQVLFNDTFRGNSDFRSVAAVDLTGDNRIDIVAVNATANALWMYRNEENPEDPTTPGWTRSDLATFAGAPNFVTVADVNNDQLPDLVVGTRDAAAPTAAGASTLAWYENGGGAMPVFTEHIITATGSNFRAASAADIDNDGFPELFTASSDDNKILRWDNNGDGSFTMVELSASVTNASSVFAADMDSDGDMDVIAGAQGSDELFWFESDGAAPPVYTVRVITNLAGGIAAVAAGDVDGDGDPDLVTANAGYTTSNGFVTINETPNPAPDENAVPDQVTLLENRLCSTNYPVKLITSAQMWGADSVASGDLNGDGAPDVVASSFFNDPFPGAARRDITWFANDGAPLPTLTEAALPLDDIADRAQSVVTGDIDGDGDLDVAAASETGNWVHWYENSGTADPSFTEWVVSDTAFSARGLFVADMDGDGDNDLLVASSAENQVSWYENDGSASPAFTKRIVTRSALGAWSVFAADLDGDGDMDVASASLNDGKVAWYINNNDEFFTFSEVVIYQPEEGALSGAINITGADADGDGDTDLYVASSYDDRIAWYENSEVVEIPGQEPPIGSGGGRLFLPHVITEADRGAAGFADGASSVNVSDMDNDGDVDLLITAAKADRVVWYESDGQAPPTYHPRAVSTTNQGSRAAITLDLNGDGLLDIVAASAIDNQVSWFLNVVGDNCINFDASRDGNIDASELAWIGRSFGLIRENETPEETWWTEIDLDKNGQVDGNDLSILGSSGVWGRSILECSFTCPE